ncbi:MAG: hypothetical protein IK107_00845 [Oscillospiraceae bacterium]|nr:hypothetical protein [Oscillospiraceae bacterium]
MTIQEARTDCAIKQKLGLHFILASVLIWTAVLCVHLTGLHPLTKNLLTFCCTAMLAPLGYLFSRLLHIDFQAKDSPFSKLMVLFSLNQLPYLLIAMWIYYEIPDRMPMVLAVIFGAHLLPYSWLYQSKNYLVFSIAVSVAALAVGLNFSPAVLALMMVCAEILFCVLLWFEYKKLVQKSG